MHVRRSRPIDLDWHRRPRPLLERLKQNGVFILYGAVCLAIALLIIYGLLASTN
jgi:hypothetical protein